MWSSVAGLPAGRDAAGARRRQRHRHVRHPARQGARRHGGHHRPRGKHEALQELGADVTHRLHRPRTSSKVRRRRRRRHPGHHGRVLPGPQHRGARAERAASRSSACRVAARPSSTCGALMAKRGTDLRDHAAGPAARREGGDRTGGARPGLAADRGRPDPAGRSTAGCRWPTPPRRTGSSRRATTSARCCWSVLDRSRSRRAPVPVGRRAGRRGCRAGSASATGSRSRCSRSARRAAVPAARSGRRAGAASARTAAPSRPWWAYAPSGSSSSAARISSSETPTCCAIRMNATRRSSAAVVAALVAAGAPGPDQPEPLVVAQRRRRDAAAGGQLADGQ